MKETISNFIIKTLDGVIPSTFVVIVLIVIFVIPKAAHIFDFFEKVKWSRIKIYDECIKFDHFEREEKELLLEIKAQNLFFRSTGIRADKGKRKAIIRLLDENRNNLSINDFRLAQKNISLHNNQLRVEIKFYNTAFHFFSYLVMVLMFAIITFIVFFVIYAIFIKHHISDVASFSGLLPLCLFNVVLYGGEIARYKASKKIKNLIA